MRNIQSILAALFSGFPFALGRATITGDGAETAFAVTDGRVNAKSKIICWLDGPAQTDADVVPAARLITAGGFSLVTSAALGAGSYNVCYLIINYGLRI